MKVVCYSVKHLKPAELSKFRREMYGFKDISNKGKYVYQRQGLMNSVRHETIFFTGLVILDDSDAEKVVKLLKKHKAKIHVVDAKKKHKSH